MFRFLTLPIVLALPFGILFGLFLGLKGMIPAALLVAGFLFYAALRVEKGLIRIFHARDYRSTGIDHSIELAMESAHPRLSRRPRIMSYPDLLPNAIIIRSLGGNGAVLLSQGLLSQLNEEELRSVLSVCLLRLDQPGWVFTSVCSMLAVWTFSIAPRAWTQLAISSRSNSEQRFTALSLLRFLLLFPLANFFVRLATPAQLPRAPDPSAFIAMRKIDRIVRSIGEVQRVASLGACALFLVNPLSRNVIYPIGR